MIVTAVYTFADGRVGTKTFSDKFYKTKEIIEENGEITLKPINYYIRKKDTNEVYDEAIDILNFEYEEVTEEEMKELVPESED